MTKLILEVGTTEANLSNKGLSVDDVNIVCKWISLKDNGASKVIFGDAPDDSDSDDDEEAWTPAVLVVGTKEADLSNKNLGVAGAIIISAWISHKDNGTLTSLNMAGNNFWVEGTVQLAAALKDNSVLAELNISDCNITYSDKDKALGIMTGVIAITNTIPTLGALTKFDISNNSLCAVGANTLAEALKGNHIMTEFNISNNSLGKVGTSYNDSADMSGINAIIDTIPTMGAIVTVNMMGNKIGKEQHSKLQEMMKAHPTLVSLFGIADEATEADLSGLGMDADDAVVPAKAANLDTEMAIAKLTTDVQALENKNKQLTTDVQEQEKKNRQLEECLITLATALIGRVCPAALCSEAPNRFHTSYNNMHNTDNQATVADLADLSRLIARVVEANGNTRPCYR